MKKIVPYLWYENQTEEAVKFYTAIFPNSKVIHVFRYGKSGAEIAGRAEGSVMSVTFELEGEEFVAFNGGPQFSFSPAVSFFVNCQTETEIENLWAKFQAGGTVLMPLGKYPFREKFGWLTDRFGVSWQFSLSFRSPKITPFLIFTGEQNGKAEEAMNLYTSLFEDSKIHQIEYDNQSERELRHTEAGKSVKEAFFALNGQEFRCVDGYMAHPFPFTPAISFFVNCESQEEVDNLWEKLSENGESQPCGWLKDKFGLSWQIIPTALGELLQNSNEEQSERIMEELFAMNKIEIAKLKKAFAQN